MINIEMVEPIDPAERAIAIRICRMNCFLDPDTGKPLADPKKAILKWHEYGNQLPYKKWIWMWNHGRQEWDPRYQSSERAVETSGGKHE